jgi:4-amino-4-deoxy-L-arabinose transferase-like glycosyltransferase
VPGEGGAAAGGWAALGPLAVILVAAALRFWGAFDISYFYGDEPVHVPSAINLAQYNVPLIANWTHPPLGALILEGTIGLFGDTPLGWRLGGVVLGTGTVALLYLVGRRLTGSARVAISAAALLAVDPFHVFFSRSTFIEVPALFFFMLFLWLLLQYREGERDWALAGVGVAVGLTAATKGYFAAAMAVAVAHAVGRAWRRSRDRGGLALRAACLLVLLPMAVYLAAYYQYFAAGHSLPDLIRMRGDALWTLTTLTADRFDRWWLEAGGTPWEWFVRPIFIGNLLVGSAEGVRYLLELNFFPVRTLALAALAYLAVRGWRERRADLVAMPLLFACVYVPFFLLRRPMASYSAVALLPFAFLALPWAAELLGRRHPRLRMLPAAIVVGGVLWGAYLYPLATAKEVPGALYGYVLGRVKVTDGPP